MMPIYETYTPHTNPAIYCLGGPKNGQWMSYSGFNTSLRVAESSIHTTTNPWWNRHDPHSQYQPAQSVIEYTYNLRHVNYLDEDGMFEGKFYVLSGLSDDEACKILVDNWRKHQVDVAEKRYQQEKYERYLELYGGSPRGYISGHTSNYFLVDDPWNTNQAAFTHQTTNTSRSTG